MRKSVFFKMALIIIPIVLACDLLQLYTSYQTFYKSNLDSCVRKTQGVTKSAADMFEYFDPDDSSDPGQYSLDFNDLCKRWGVTYIYAIEADPKTKDEKYLAIGFGDDATEKVKKTRYPGVVVKKILTEAQLKVARGEKETVTVHEVTALDDTLTCYLRVKEHINFKTLKRVEFKKPVIIGVDMSFSAVMKRFQRDYIKNVILDLIFTFILTISIFIIFYLKVNGPVKRISKRMKNFVSDRDKGFEKLKVKGKDEFAEMSRSFNLMAEEIDTYIDDIEKLNKEKHTQETELEIGRNIQTGLLKPSSYNNNNVSINALMRAAKNVGGDLYDYQVLDDGRVFIVIADVSGKGISAALFMSRAITLLHQYALLGYSPAKMLEEYNNTLAETNPNGLFITTFAAVYDPKTGELTYSNAGHNRPYIISESLVELDGAAGMASGVFPGIEYEQETVILKPNDVVFLYTDGVNESENSSGEFFGTEALENELKKHIGLKTDTVSSDVLKTVREFSKGAVQSDDLTILTMKIQSSSVHREITVKNQVENLVKLNEFINSEQSIPEEIKAELFLIAEELFVNICSYAYGEKEGDITVSIDSDNESVTLTFEDYGVPFDPTEKVIDIEVYDHDNSIGGLGRYLAFELADECSYSYSNNKNILKITKHRE